MDRSQASPGSSDDDFGPPGRRRPSKLGWILVGWIVLSALAVAAALVLNRGSDRPTTGAASSLGPGGLSEDAGAQGDARLPAAAQSPAPAPAEGSRDWSVHLLYTAVEKYYRGPRTPVSGCPTSVCTAKRVSFGTFPATFVQAVKSAGSGVISSGRYAHKFLDWDPAVGFWLDTAARGYGSTPMTSFASARSTSTLLPLGTHLQISVCGPSPRHDAIRVCGRLRSARWSVAAEGTPSPARDIWLYVGRQTGPGTAGERWISNFQHATLRIG